MPSHLAANPAQPSHPADMPYLVQVRGLRKSEQTERTTLRNSLCAQVVSNNVQHKKTLNTGLIWCSKTFNTCSNHGWDHLQHDLMMVRTKPSQHLLAL
jgi:hypothetical protein